MRANIGDDRYVGAAGRGFAISASTVTGDYCDRGMSSEPGLSGRGLTIRQQGDYPAPFQVADDAGVPVIAPPSPIVNANDLGRVRRRAAAASDHAQERVVADPANSSETIEDQPFSQTVLW